MELLKDLLGLGLQAKEMSVLQICMRAVVVFFASLVLVRIANRRFLAKFSPLDVILGFVLASVLARAINGSGPLFHSIVAGFLLVVLHRALAAMSFRSELIGKLVKGEPHILVENGDVRDQALSKHNISVHDLHEALRISGNVDEPAAVKTAILERNGDISVVKSR